MSWRTSSTSIGRGRSKCEKWFKRILYWPHFYPF